MGSCFSRGWHIMANEAVIIELLGATKGRPINWQIPDASAIPKGTIMKSVTGGDRKCAATTADDPFAGIAAMEKVANDGSETMTLYTHGIFDLTNAAIADATAGARCDINGANLFTISDAAGAVKPGCIILMEDAVKSAVGACLIGSGF